MLEVKILTQVFTNYRSLHFTTQQWNGTLFGIPVPSLNLQEPLVLRCFSFQEFDMLTSKGVMTTRLFFPLEVYFIGMTGYSLQWKHSRQQVTPWMQQSIPSICLHSWVSLLGLPHVCHCASMLWIHIQLPVCCFLYGWESSRNKTTHLVSEGFSSPLDLSSPWGECWSSPFSESAQAEVRIWIVRPSSSALSMVLCHSLGRVRGFCSIHFLALQFLSCFGP